MGTGVGEAMLIGAVTGAGTSAITGGDPLKGAMFGALGGGVTSGISGAMTGAAESAAVSAGEGAASNFAQQAASQTGAGLDYSGMIPTETGFYNPATMADVAAPASTQGLASNQISQMQNLSPEMKNLFTSNLNAGIDPTQTIREAATYNNLASNPLDQYKGISSGDALANRENRSILQTAQNYIINNPRTAAAIGGAGTNLFLNPSGVVVPEEEKYKGPLSRFRFNPDTYRPAYAAGGLTDNGGIDNIETGMQRNMYPQSQFSQSEYSTPSQLPTGAEVVMASGGIADLGGYSDGGRLLKGPGDGMSDSIPAKIGQKQPARLADGEFVVPADVVSHLGNGSTDAGAKQLYSMMDKVRKARTGNKKQGKEINPRKFVPA